MAKRKLAADVAATDDDSCKAHKDKKQRLIELNRSTDTLKRPKIQLKVTRRVAGVRPRSQQAYSEAVASQQPYTQWRVNYPGTTANTADIKSRIEAVRTRNRLEYLKALDTQSRTPPSRWAGAKARVMLTWAVTRRLEGIPSELLPDSDRFLQELLDGSTTALDRIRQLAGLPEADEAEEEEGEEEEEGLEEQEQRWEQDSQAWRQELLHDLQPLSLGEPFDLLKEEACNLLQPEADWFNGTSIKLQEPPSSCMMLLPHQQQQERQQQQQQQQSPPQQQASAHSSPPSSACTHVLQWGSSTQQPVTSHGTVSTAAGTAFCAPEPLATDSFATGLRVTLENNAAEEYLQFLHEKRRREQLMQQIAQAEQELQQQQPGLMPPVPPAQMLVRVLQQQRYAGHSFQQLLQDMPQLLQRAAQMRLETARQPVDVMALLLQQDGAAGSWPTAVCAAAPATAPAATATAVPTWGLSAGAPADVYDDELLANILRSD